jgi:N-acetylglucosaminyldiphosphoundecaprenol N-acetyl-beta-D-mannosaminyltransferase
MSASYITTFVNTFSYYKLLDSDCPIEDIDCFFIDGLLQVKLHNLFHKHKTNRASFDFSSLADDFFRYSVRHNLKMAIIAASDDEVKIAVDNLRTKYPGLCIPYFRNGYINGIEEKAEVVFLLKDYGIDLIVLGMGTPVQEEFAVYLKTSGVNAYVFTCGGFITQTAKKLDYYSTIAKKSNLRWLQRAIEYKHVRKRLLVDYPKNIIRYLLEHIILLCKLCPLS